MRSTWQDSDGKLWRVDRRATKDEWVLTPDWPGYLSHPPDRTVSAADLVRYWQMIETDDQRLQRMKRQRKFDCELGRHEDPDHTGGCIHCGAVLDEDDIIVKP
jgi:hypothetical protein